MQTGIGIYGRFSRCCKTEASKALLSEFDAKILRLDIDDLRERFPGYSGGNSHLFQAGACILLEKAQDLALDQRQSFILDGTMADFERAKKNIQRSLNKKRTVQILFVYQQPDQAWKFVQAREKVEGRRVLPELFIKQYFSSRETVNQLKKEFGKRVKLDLLIKNVDGSNKVYHANVNEIDSYIGKLYSFAALKEIVYIKS